MSQRCVHALRGTRFETMLILTGELLTLVNVDRVWSGRELATRILPVPTGTGKMRVAKLRVGILRAEVRAKRASI